MGVSDWGKPHPKADEVLPRTSARGYGGVTRVSRCFTSNLASFTSQYSRHRTILPVPGPLLKYGLAIFPHSARNFHYVMETPAPERKIGIAPTGY
jgi:hypothetical protein